MKTPRISDFDPDTKARALKSSLEGMPAIEKPLNPTLVTSPSPTPTSDQSTAAPRTASRKPRAFIRRTFDLYEDQLSYLTREALQDRLAGKEGSMNAMVREAIDEWIEKRKSRK
jgi:hypothetical protein